VEGWLIISSLALILSLMIAHYPPVSLALVVLLIIPSLPLVPLLMPIVMIPDYRQLGVQLAALHLSGTHEALHNGRFGFAVSNYLALTPLNNTWDNDW
jgi:hypothetical protein